MEASVMDVLLLILSVLFLMIALFMRRLRNRMEKDMKKNIVPFMGVRHMIRHGAGSHKVKSKKKPEPPKPAEFQKKTEPQPPPASP